MLNWLWKRKRKKIRINDPLLSEMLGVDRLDTTPSGNIEMTADQLAAIAYYARETRELIEVSTVEMERLTKQMQKALKQQEAQAAAFDARAVLICQN